MLPSGLDEVVANGEDLTRFLTSKSQFNSQMAKPAAFLPAHKDRETSVFRQGAQPPAALWVISDEYVAGNRTVHGAAIVKAGDVRATGLDVFPEEPPPWHAAIRGWPWLENDPELQKAQQKELAMLVASKAILLRR